MTWYSIIFWAGIGTMFGNALFYLLVTRRDQRRQRDADDAMVTKAEAMTAAIRRSTAEVHRAAADAAFRVSPRGQA